MLHIHRRTSACAHARPISAVQVTSIRYIGLQGDHTHGQRMAVNATYELIATPNDDALFSHSHEHHLAPNAGGRPGM